MHEKVLHLKQLATATPLGQITCGYKVLMLNVANEFSTIPNFMFMLGLQVQLVEKAWLVINWMKLLMSNLFAS